MNPIDASPLSDSPSHPTAEAWADYLCGELTPEARARIDDHIRGCASCQQQAAQGRATLGALDEWTLPRQRRATPRLRDYARWAIAACAVLGLGWAGGRFSAPQPPTSNQLLAEFGPALRQTLREQFQAELSAALQKSDERTQDQFVELAQAWAQARNEDRRSIAALFQQSEQQRSAETAALRRDLETVAVVAQAAIGATQQQLTQLAANAQGAPTAGDLP